MLEVLQHQHSPVAQQIWLQMSQQLSSCTDCINSYHQAQVGCLVSDLPHLSLQALHQHMVACGLQLQAAACVCASKVMHAFCRHPFGPVVDT